MRAQLAVRDSREFEVWPYIDARVRSIGRRDFGAKVVEGAFGNPGVRFIEFRRRPADVERCCNRRLSIQLAFISQPGGAEVSAAITADIEGLFGKDARSADRVGEIERRFARSLWEARYYQPLLLAPARKRGCAE
jgi:hypothetical protein